MGHAGADPLSAHPAAAVGSAVTGGYDKAKGAVSSLFTYENGKWLYGAAAATAGSAALIIKRPWANYVVLMIGVMTSNPGGMSSSGHTWRTLDAGGSTHELHQLQDDLAMLKAELEKQGKWEGAARAKFDEAYDTFMESVKSLESTRNATGEAVDQSARLYYMGAKAFMVIAGGMLTFALAMLAINRYFPLASVVDHKVGRTTVNAGRQILLKQGVTVAALGYLMHLAIQRSETTGKLFPRVSAIPTELSSLKSGGLPEFTGAGLKYDQQAGFIPLADDAALNGGLDQL
ncbi:WXG100 family type VII secretion target [Nonomuraea sp. NPDC050202]|uniref:WXG100 family type VII secretion target n=1 Tax=Nonomuraea sp. NPDC050202 TaxID=3155035 RepID=UPI0033FF2DB8